MFAEQVDQFGVPVNEGIHDQGYWKPGRKYSNKIVWRLVKEVDPKADEYPKHTDMPVYRRAMQAPVYIYDPKFDYKLVDSGWDLNWENVEEYMEDFERALEYGGVPPIVLVRDPSTDNYHLVDGAHRIAAARQLGVKTLPALIGDIQFTKG